MRIVGGVWWSGLALAAVVAVAAMFAGRQAGEPLAAGEPKAKSPAALPPLKVEKGAPLLLDALPDAKPAKTPEEGPVADNIACYCCHRNFEEEPMVRVHAKANVGCVKCHGESVAHRNDEDNTTPPDVIYPAQRIEKACQECHESHDAPAKKVIACWQQKCPAKTHAEELVCTDCHGEHRLKVRTVRWDKETRKLISDPARIRLGVEGGKAASSPSEKKAN
jgi:hypothetical protein